MDGIVEDMVNIGYTVQLDTHERLERDFSSSAVAILLSASSTKEIPSWAPESHANIF